MMTGRTRTLAIAALVVTTAVALAAQTSTPKKNEAPGLTGKWTMTLQTSEGSMTLALTLKQDRNAVTGVWSTPHDTDVPLEGEFKDGALTLASPETHEMQVSFTGKLKADGSLAGTLSSAMGDMTWTAKRAK